MRRRHRIQTIFAGTGLRILSPKIFDALHDACRFSELHEGFVAIKLIAGNVFGVMHIDYSVPLAQKKTTSRWSCKSLPVTEGVVGRSTGSCPIGLPECFADRL